VTRLSFGLVPSSRSGETLASFEALATWMRSHTPIDFTSTTPETYGALATSIREGKSDVAWLPPVAYAWLAERVTPIGSFVRGGETSYSAALVVREDSTLRELADLRGTRAGWVDPWSAAGYVVPRIELVRRGIDPETVFHAEIFYGNHRDTLLALGRDECDVVGTYARTPAAGSEAREGAWTALPDLRIRVLATFGAIPNDVIAVRRNLGPREHELAIEAFRAACSDPSARALLRAVFDGDELREGLDPGHDALRRDYERGVAHGLFDALGPESRR
jgi:phosphate/phosphite/phosphonate ABC transporter binding protein